MIALDQAGAALPAARMTPPTRELNRWVSEGWSDRSAGPAWRIVADEAAYLIYSEIDAAAGSRSRLSVVGPRSRHLEIDRSRRRFTSGLRLRPGALGPLFGVTAHELVDRSVSLDGLLGGSGAAWHERIAESPPDRRVAVLYQLAAAHLTDAPGPDWRIGALLAADIGVSARPRVPPDRSPTLAARCRELGLSPRTMRNAFRDEVGLSPSTVLKVRRLHRVLLDRFANPAVRWATLAASHGYADQSHLIRDCRELLGETPEAFGRRADLFKTGAKH